jgi:hypothetical protein
MIAFLNIAGKSGLAQKWLIKRGVTPIHTLLSVEMLEGGKEVTENERRNNEIS